MHMQCIATHINLKPDSLMHTYIYIYMFAFAVTHYLCTTAGSLFPALSKYARIFDQISATFSSTVLT